MSAARHLIARAIVARGAANGDASGCGGLKSLVHKLDAHLRPGALRVIFRIAIADRNHGQIPIARHRLLDRIHPALRGELAEEHEYVCSRRNRTDHTHIEHDFPGGVALAA